MQQSDAEADEDDERSLVLNIVGDDLGMLIGRQNETLSALEFITRLMTNQQTHTRTGFVVDVNGHRAEAGRVAAQTGAAHGRPDGADRAHRGHGADAAR